MKITSKKTKQLKPLLFLAISGILLYSLTSCNKDDSGGSSPAKSLFSKKAPTEISLLTSYLPANSDVVFVSQRSNENYKKFTNSAWSKIGAASEIRESYKEALIEGLKNSSRPVEGGNAPEADIDTKELENIIATLEKIKITFIPAENIDNEDFKSLGISAKLTEALGVKFSFIGKIKNKPAFTEKLKADVATAKEGGLKISEEPKGQFDLAYKINLAEIKDYSKISPSPVNFILGEGINVLLKDENLIIGNYTPDEMIGFINQSKEPKPIEVLSKVTDKLAEDEESTLGYLAADVSKIYERVILLAKGTAGNAAPNAAGANPLSDIPYQSPITSITSKISYGETLENKTNLTLSDEVLKSDFFKDPATVFNGDSLIQSIPADQTLFVNISTSGIKKLLAFSTLLSDLSQGSAGNAEVQAGINKANAFLEKISALGIGVGSMTPGAMFPSVSLFAKTSDSQNLMKEIKESVIPSNPSDGGMGAFLSPWQEKTFNGAKLTYSASPLGIGAYLGEKKSPSGETIIVLSSTESGALDFVSPAAGKASSLLDNFNQANVNKSGAVKTILSAKAPSNLFYINFPKIASVVQSLQGSLSMFTGGQQAVKPSYIEMLTKIGNFVAFLSFENNSIGINTSYWAAKNEAAPVS